MKPSKGIKSIKFKWKDFSNVFNYKYCPLFYIGGGTWKDSEFKDVWHYQKHFYFYKWCYLTIKGVKYE